MATQKKAFATIRGVPLTEAQLQKGYSISGGVDGVLTKLFNLICLDITGGRGISPIQWNRLMIDYTRKVAASSISIDRTSIRGNMNKELRRPGMTWNVFCGKSLPFLKMDCFSLAVDYTLENNSDFSSVVSASFNPESPYRKRLPVDRYTNPQGRVRKRTVTSGALRGSVAYSGDASSILARMFNTICLDITDGKGISEAEWNRMLDEYIDRHINPTSIKERQSARSNLKKELRRGKMTWKVFCKGLQFLKVQSMKITVTCIREDGIQSQAETSVSFSRKAN